MSVIDNPQLDLASSFVKFTNKNIFLTGKAGTGKTTFLHKLKNESIKRMIVVAPTGVAAINAGGVTIHSFFQLPFGPQIPKGPRSISIDDYADAEDSRGKSALHRFSREKINIIKSLDLLVIDEISMVRADLLDGIDEVLRRYRNQSQPFGGVQLLMIGDLQQLTPVVKDDEWALLKKYYDTVYFFSSLALKQTEMIPIELKHIYRQQDQKFINILNQIRENRLDVNALAELNKRFIPEFQPKDEEGYITLTTHNNQARSINNEYLKTLKGVSFRYEATITGDFPEMSFPTEKELDIKVGAQVMFVKNDSSSEKLFFNGKIGRIADIDEDDIIWVECIGDESPIAVGRALWDNTKYTLNPETDEIEEKVIGTFEQYPLKLAWAITIHKSQGLTFERAIIDAKAAFASGQVYVALSRCKSLEGLVLSSPLSAENIITDSKIDQFNRNVEKNEPSTHQLDQGKRDYQKQLLLDLFSFDVAYRSFNYLKKLISDHSEVVPATLRTSIIEIRDLFHEKIFIIGEKFKAQLALLIFQAEDIEPCNTLQDRLKKGSVYFLEMLKSDGIRAVGCMSIDIDNKAVNKTFTDTVNRIVEEIRVKEVCLNGIVDGFKMLPYMQLKAKATIEKPAAKHEKSIADYADNIDNPQLYLVLKSWRNMKAEELNVPHYQIFPQKSLYELIEKLPTTMGDLKKIKGFGEKKIRQFGVEIIDIIADYCDDAGIIYNKSYVLEIEEKTNQSKKIDTKQFTLDLIASGKSIADIAKERGLAISTIESHVIHFIANDNIDVTMVVDADSIKAITSYFETVDHVNLAAAKEALGESISYNQIRMVLASMR